MARVGPQRHRKQTNKLPPRVGLSPRTALDSRNPLWGHNAELPLGGVENRQFPVTSVTRAGFQRKNFKQLYLTANYL
jgi:hypothetical protein